MQFMLSLSKCYSLFFGGGEAAAEKRAQTGRSIGAMGEVLKKNLGIFKDFTLNRKHENHLSEIKSTVHN